MTLPRQWQRHALALVEQASPLEGEFFRSVELAYAHPDDVVSGEGTRSYGGRFVRPGLRAVYGSVDEETAFRESAARVNRLAGRGGAQVASYPRITYVIAVRICAHVALTDADINAAAILPACLDPNDLSASQEVGEFLQTHGIQAVVFPSAIPGFTGRNLKDYIEKHAKQQKRSWEEDYRILYGSEQKKRTGKRPHVPLVKRWAHLTVKGMTRREIRPVLDEIAARAPIMANRTLALVRKMFNFAIEHDWVESIPASWSSDSRQSGSAIAS